MLIRRKPLRGYNGHGPLKSGERLESSDAVVPTDLGVPSTSGVRQKRQTRI